MTVAKRQGAPVIGFCAHSGTGKTTLLKALIAILERRGMRVGVVKHAHHEFDTDQPGKDSYELRKAGARRMLVSSSRRSALISEVGEGESEPGLNDLLARLDDGALDLILVEGFKRERFPKIELARAELGREPMYPNDPDIIALATDAPPAGDIAIPVLDLNDAEALADFICEHSLADAAKK